MNKCQRRRWQTGQSIRQPPCIPKFTNEVQHLVKVLPLDATIHNITLEDRCEMARFHTTGHSHPPDRGNSGIARHRPWLRELNRNGSTAQGYQPGYAEDQQARARRWQGSKLERDSTLRATVLAQLQHGWSPQQVAGRLAREQHRPVISHETIYRLDLCADGPQNRVRLTRHYLPQGQSQTRAPVLQGAQPGVLHRSAPPAGAAALRGRGSPHSGPLGGRPDVVPDLRPSHLDRSMKRHSRLLIAARPPEQSRRAHRPRQFATLLAPLRPTWRQTITFV